MTAPTTPPADEAQALGRIEPKRVAVDRAQLDRLQAYNLDAGAAVNLVAAIRDKWGPSTPTHLPVVEPLSPVVDPAEDEIGRIAGLIEPLWRTGASKNAMCKAALDRPYAGSYAMKIDRAIGRLEAAQASSTTTALDRRFHIVAEVESGADGSSSRTAAPILRMGAR